MLRSDMAADANIVASCAEKAVEPAAHAGLLSHRVSALRSGPGRQAESSARYGARIIGPPRMEDRRVDPLYDDPEGVSVPNDYEQVYRDRLGNFIGTPLLSTLRNPPGSRWSRSRPEMKTV